MQFLQHSRTKRKTIDIWAWSAAWVCNLLLHECTWTAFLFLSSRSNKWLYLVQESCRTVCSSDKAHQMYRLVPTQVGQPGIEQIGSASGTRTYLTIAMVKFYRCLLLPPLFTAKNGRVSHPVLQLICKKTLLFSENHSRTQMVCTVQ